MKFKNKKYTPKKYQFDKHDEEIELFIHDVIEMVSKKSDFSLVDRAKEDLAWIKAYQNPDSNIINIKDIERNYLENTSHDA